MGSPILLLRPDGRKDSQNIVGKPREGYINTRPPHTERPFVVCKGNDFMITITGNAKEIAALIEGLYGQRKNEFNAEELRRLVGKILTEEHSKTHGIHIDGIYQQNGKINISKERMNTGWL